MYNRGEMTVLGEYLDSLVGRSDKTVKLHKKVLFQYYDFIGADEKQFDVNSAQRFLKGCSKRGMENVSVATYTSVIRSFLHFLAIPDKELNKIRAPRVGFKIMPAIDEENWEKFLRQPETLRDMTIAYTLLYGACRVGELRRIKVKDVDTKSNMIIIKGMRDAKVRGPIQINQDTADVIQEYVKIYELKKDDHLIPLSERRIEQLVKKWAKDAKIPHADEITPHSLRRSLGKAFYKKTGKDIEKTRIMLGHQSISSTQHYLSIEEEEVRDDYKKYFD